MKRIFLAAIALLILVILTVACEQASPTPTSTPTLVDRYTRMPGTKITPTEDFWPPSIAAGWSQPEPLPYPVSTAGGEDSPFITPDNQTLYIFFTPDVSIPAEKQLLDGVTGIWVTRRSEDSWSEPQRVWLENPGELTLDGCEFVLGDQMWFCSFVTADGQELWFDGQSTKGRPGPAIFRSLRQPDGSWGAAEEIISTFAGEPTLSGDGKTLYFGHHYYSADLSQMLEVDIYTSTRLEP